MQASNQYSPPANWVWRYNDEVKCCCLWSNCFEAFDSLPDLNEHIQAHIDLLPAGFQEEYICPIEGCAHELRCPRALLRHLNMHIFHAHRQHYGLFAVLRRPDISHLTSCGFPASPRIVYEGSALKCEWDDCKFLFDDILLYSEHMQVHVDMLESADRDHKSLLKCGWKGCTMGFKSKTSLRVHIRHHSGDKATACPYCGTFFANNSKLFDHMLRKATTSDAGPLSDAHNEFVCKLCRKRFESQRLLREHCRRHVMNHKCEYCAVTVDSPSALHRHIVSVHAKKRDHRCDQCEQRFAQRADLERHRALHNSELEFECEQCGEKFRWRKQLASHVRKHEKGYTQHTHLCHLCDAKYANGYGLTRHLTKKHNCPVPDGFTRFQYKKCADGFARLQTKRCLSKALAMKLGIAPEDSTYVTV